MHNNIDYNAAERNLKLYVVFIAQIKVKIQLGTYFFKRCRVSMKIASELWIKTSGINNIKLFCQNYMKGKKLNV